MKRKSTDSSLSDWREDKNPKSVKENRDEA